MLNRFICLQEKILFIFFSQNEKRVKLLLEYEDENLAGIDGDDFHIGDSTEDSDDPVCK
jgi:ELKS/RAB6-interacting/CAST family protein 1